MNEDKLKKVRDWLKKSGYPLELQVARQVEELGFAWQQSWHYLDSDTRKYRETDIIAWKECLLKTSGNAVLVRLSLCIECKRGDKPWVAFTSNRTSPGDLIELFSTPSSEYGAEVLKRLAPDLLHTPGFQRANEQLAYTVVEVELASKGAKTGRDSAYAAIRAVSDGAIARARIADEGDLTLAEIVIPIVVYDGDLVAASLGDDGELALEPTAEVMVVQRRPTDLRPFTVVRVVTAVETQSYLERFLESAAVLESRAELIRTAIEEHRERSGPIVVL